MECIFGHIDFVVLDGKIYAIMSLDTLDIGNYTEPVVVKPKLRLISSNEE